MMVYLFHLYNSGSRRDVIKPMVYLFIYTTPAHNLPQAPIAEVRHYEAATLSNIIDGLLFRSTLYRPMASRTRSSSLHILSPPQAS
jgi:hypothetical protein